MSRKGNVLLVANWDSGVGYAWWLMENFWASISSHFSKQGVECYLAYPSISEIPAVIEESELQLEEIDFRIRDISGLLKIASLIRNRDIKYVYFSDYPSVSVFYVWLRIFGVRKVAVHDHTPGERTAPTGVKRVLKTFIQRLPWVTADTSIAVTDFVRDRHINVNCIPLAKCHVAKNGIIPIDLQSSDRHYAHIEFNIPRDRSIIVTTGRATYYKGIDFFIQCAHEIVNKHEMETVHFLYCGNGPDLEAFKERISTLDLTCHFTFAGNRNDVREILPSCDVGFHAATGEVGYSLSILEYMSAGLVAIVPSGPSTALATRNLETGLTYTTRDTDSAVQAIQLALDPGKSQLIKENARAVVEEEYCLEQTNRQLISILNECFS